MVKGALFVGWGAIITGREKIAPTVLGEAVEYLQRMKKQGVIDSFEVVILEPHGGDLGGFVLVKGEKESIAKLRVEDEFVRLIISVQLVHQKVGVVGAYTDAEMQTLFQTWDEQEEKLIWHHFVVHLSYENGAYKYKVKQIDYLQEYYCSGGKKMSGKLLREIHKSGLEQELKDAIIARIKKYERPYKPEYVKSGESYHYLLDDEYLPIIDYVS
jgi:hypothetical protein